MPKFHLEHWKRVCEPLQTGGLGIRNLAIFNKALLGKCLWRYGTKRDSLWRRVVDKKYGSMWGGWCSNRVQHPYGVSLWKFIRAGWDSFSRLFTFTVGDGSRIKFWYDSWCGDQPLQLQFPELFRLAHIPKASMANHLRFQGANRLWDIEFTKAIGNSNQCFLLWSFYTHVQLVRLIRIHLVGVSPTVRSWR